MSAIPTPSVESGGRTGAVFLSYASQDADAARRICDALTAAGVEVWFDQSELRGGDAWDAKIRRQIKECALFVPVISANTQARREGYFRLEWRLAVERMRHMDDDLPFLMPVVIDDTKDAEAFVPEKFRDVQWTRLAAGHTEPAFADRVWSLLPGNATGSTSSASRPAAAGKEAAAFQRTPRRWHGGILAAAGVAIILAGAGWWQFSRPSRERPAAVALTRSEQLVTTARSLYEPWDLATADDFRMADGLLKQATEMDPLNADAWASFAILSYGQSVFGFDKSDARFELLRTSAARAVKLAPSSDRAKFAQALRYRGAPDRADDALHLMRELAERNSGDRFILRQVGSILRTQGKLEESLGWYERADALPGGDPIALCLRAQTLELLDRLDEAEPIFERVLRARPDFARAHEAYLSFLLFGRGNLERVKAALERLPAQALSDERVAMDAAWVWYLARDPVRAGAALRHITQEYIEADPWHLPKGYLAGWVHQLAGRQDAAVAEWRTAAQIVEKRLGANPNHLFDRYVQVELLALLGNRPAADAALRVFEEVQASQPYNNLLTWQIYALLGDEEKLAAYFTDQLRRRRTDPRAYAAIWTDPRAYAAIFRFHPLLDRYRDRAPFRALAVEAEKLFARGSGHGSDAKASVPPAPDPKSVVVLPFANLSGDPTQEYFSDGLTEEIRDALARERDLRVVPRTSAFSFKEKNLPLPEIARALNVAQVVEGTVRRAGGVVRITATLTRISDGFVDPLPAISRELKDGADMYAIQEAVARAVVEKLTRRTSMAPVAVLTKIPEAYDAYLRGRAAPGTGSGGVRRSIAHFARAVELDPSFALAWARLAEARSTVYGWLSEDSVPQLLSDARTALAKTFELQPELPEALVVRARLSWRVEHDLAAARRDLHRVELLQPLAAEVPHLRAFFAADENNWSAATTFARQAIERDPKNADLANILAVNIYTPQGDFVAADGLYAQVQAINVQCFNNRIRNRETWGGPEAALHFIERSPKSLGDAYTDTLRATYLLQLGRVAEARPLVEMLAENFAAHEGTEAERDVLLSSLLPVFQLAGRDALAGRVAEAKRTRWNRSTVEGSRDEQGRSALIQACRYLGDQAGALAAFRPVQAELAARSDIPWSEMRRIIPCLALMGQRDEAIKRLERFAANGVQRGYSLRFDPALLSLQSDPRFVALMKKAEAWAQARPDPVDP